MIQNCEMENVKRTESSQTSFQFVTDRTSHLFTNLDPFTNYSFYLRSVFVSGEGDENVFSEASETVVQQTAAGGKTSSRILICIE